jgi:hypothetical protein
MPIKAGLLKTVCAFSQAIIFLTWTFSETSSCHSEDRIEDAG